MNPSASPLPLDGLGPMEQFLEQLALAEAAGFAPLASFDELSDGGGVSLDSRTWCGLFLGSEANPWRPDVEPERHVHRASDAAADLLLTRCPVDEELELEVIESVEFLLLRLVGTPAVPGASEAETDATIESLADRVLARSGSGTLSSGQAEPYRWEFSYHPPLADGTRFSSAPDEWPVTLPGWWSRVDGALDGGRLLFFGHKKRASGDGRMVFLDASAWFDGTCWDPYAG